MPSTQVKQFDGESIEFETYDPSGTDAGLIFVHHGVSRSTYSGGYDDLANETGLSVFAPIFPESRYDGDDYQMGGVFGGSRVLPEDQWTTRLEAPMIDWAKTQVDGDDPDVFLFGHSAGGQYLSRVVAYDAPEGVDRFVVANPSTWVLPSLTEDGPYGFDGLGTDAQERAALQKYLAQPMTLYLGGEDDNPNDSDLATGSAAMRQGSNRLERGINTFEMGKEVAEKNGWAFGWKLVIADGVGHSGSDMLRAPEMIEALRPSGVVTPDKPDEPDVPVVEDPDGPVVYPEVGETFEFSGHFRRTKVSYIDELNFDDGDALSFSGYDRGTFWRSGARSAEIDSFADLRALDRESREVSLSTRGDADLTIRIEQDHGAMHKIVVHELVSDSLL